LLKDLLVNSRLSLGENIMLGRWFAVAFLGLTLPTLASHQQPFENTAIVRTVDLGGSLVHVTTTYAIKALATGAEVYTIALGPEEKQKTSWIEAKLKGQAEALALEDLGYDADRYVGFLVRMSRLFVLLLFI
jgi:oligosaccharyltransferase complex subunit alpha (ribophorin I)